MGAILGDKRVGAADSPDIGFAPADGTPSATPSSTIAASSGILTARKPPRDLIHDPLDALLRPQAWARLRLCVDIAALALASGITLLSVPTSAGATSHDVQAVIFSLVVLVMMHIKRTPDERLNGSLLDTSAHVLGVASLAAMLTVALDSLIGEAHPLALVLELWFWAVVYLGLARASLLSFRRRAMRTRAHATPTLVVGAGIVGARLVRRLVEDPGYGLRPVGYLDADPLRSGLLTDALAPVIGGPDDLGDAIRTTGARRVILAFSSAPDHILVAKARECQKLGVEVSLVPRLYESINERTTLDHVGGLPLLTLHSIDPRGWQFAVKHAIDRSLALLGLILTSPLIAATALAVRLSSPGPVLFRQRRVGRDGREFDVLKFRTMRVADARSTRFDLPAGCAPGGVEGDDRRTRVGSALRILSLDELPQLFNVLRGDMSLVGPRPERPEYVERFARDVAGYEDRHRVKSGITGWAQVNGLRGQTSIADRVEWDNYYIQNWSLRTDLRILALTVAEVLRFRG